MKRIASHTVMMISAMLMTSAAWAQSNTDLPALPPESNANVVLPPPLLAPEEPSSESVAPPQVEQSSVPLPTENAATVMSPVETTTAPAISVPTTPDTGSVSTPADTSEMKENFRPSYGDFEQSLFYSAQDVDRMKKILFAYESVKRPDAPIVAQAQDEFTALLQQPVVTVQEPQAYPSFHLSSIVYRSAKDWLFWMNGTKYTPKRLPGNMKVVVMSPRSATFAWEPEYISRAKTRFEQNLIDSSIPKHIKAQGNHVRYDEKNDRFLFTVSPNQSFVSGAFAVYEGKHGDKTVPEMSNEAQIEEVLSPAPPPLAQPIQDPDAELKATMRGLQQMGSNLGQLAPRNNPNANNDTPGGIATPPTAAAAPVVIDVPAPQRAGEPPPAEPISP